MRLATLPTFGSKWLLPRLHAFYNAHPGMLVHIHSRIEAINFDTSEIDAAIGVASHDLPGLICHRLHAEELVVILPPEAAADSQAWSPARISEEVLLNVANNPHAWGEWFSHHACRTARCAWGRALS